MDPSGIPLPATMNNLGLEFNEIEARRKVSISRR
jgi:hypothetical protein